MRLNAGCGDDFWGDVRIDKNLSAAAANHVGDITELHWPDRSFEETRCISVLEHIPNWREAVEQLCRVTKHKLTIEVPVNSDLRKTEAFRLLWPTPENIRLFFSMKKRAEATFWQFTGKDLATTVAAHGFKTSCQKIVRRYHGMISRCWRIIGIREQ